MRLTTCMLADGARVGQDGKLYIYGGRWDRIFAASVPSSHPTMTIVLVAEVDYSEAFKDHQVEGVLRDQDGADVGPRFAVGVRVGHPPELERGSSLSVPLALDQVGVTFPNFGRYEWVISLNGEVAGRLPITVIKVQPTQAMLIPGQGIGLVPPDPGGSQAE